MTIHGVLAQLTNTAEPPEMLLATEMPHSVGRCDTGSTDDLNVSELAAGTLQSILSPSKHPHGDN